MIIIWSPPATLTACSCIMLDAFKICCTLGGWSSWLALNTTAMDVSAPNTTVTLPVLEFVPNTNELPLSVM